MALRKTLILSASGASSRRTQSAFQGSIKDEAAAPLREAWYYAAPARQLRPGRLLARVMLGEPIVLGRDQSGTVFALRAGNPAHRGLCRIGGAPACRDGAVWRGARRLRHRADGPGARPLCAPRLVVAVAAFGARKGEGVCAIALGLHDDPAHAFLEF